MSFSGEVREELAGHLGTSRHCQIAELAVMFCYNGRIGRDEEGKTVFFIQTENEQVIRKCFTLLKKSFKIEACVAGSGSYTLKLCEEEQIKRILQAFKLLDVSGAVNWRTDFVNPLLIKNACCRRAFLRGAYLSIGSMSDPEKSYHLEFVCGTQQQAEIGRAHV